MLLDRRQYLRRIGEHVVVSAKDTKFTCASGHASLCPKWGLD